MIGQDWLWAKILFLVISILENRPTKPTDQQRMDTAFERLAHDERMKWARKKKRLKGNEDGEEKSAKKFRDCFPGITAVLDGYWFFRSPRKRLVFFRKKTCLLRLCANQEKKREPVIQESHMASKTRCPAQLLWQTGGLLELVNLHFHLSYRGRRLRFETC